VSIPDRSRWAVAWLVALLAALGGVHAFRTAADCDRQVRVRQSLLDSLVPDAERLAVYRRTEARLRRAWAASGTVAQAADPAALLPPGCSAPARTAVARTEPAAGWVGVSATLSWERLAASNALAAAAAWTAASPPWRLAELNIEALREEGDVRLSARVETAEPAPAANAP
jgi:hypothetical protein